MTGSYLLDTNMVIALFKGDREIKARLDAVPEVFLPSVALGELHFGAARSSRPESNAARIDDFAATCTVIGVDAGTARHYGRIKGQLRAVTLNDGTVFTIIDGKPVPVSGCVQAS